MTNIFDKIVCLVLDRQLPEVTIHKELAAYGWEVEFFVAGDGITVSPERYNYIDKKVAGRAQAFNYAACVRQMTQQAQNDNLNNFLMLEADAVLTDKFTTIWPLVLEELKTGNYLWDTLMIGGNHLNGHVQKVSPHLIRPSYSLDYHATAFNWTMYDIILGMEPSAYATFDGKLADAQKRGVFNCLALDPSIITQKAGFSLNENRMVNRSINHNLG